MLSPSDFESLILTVCLFYGSKYADMSRDSHECDLFVSEQDQAYDLDLDDVFFKES